MTIDMADNITESKELNAISQMEAKGPIKALPCHIPDYARAKKTVLTVNYFHNTIQHIKECKQYINTAHKSTHMNAIANQGQKLLAASANN
eukprot:3714574-Ditylum_brightwellii.AAC.1